MMKKFTPTRQLQKMSTIYLDGSTGVSPMLK